MVIQVPLERSVVYLRLRYELRARKEFENNLRYRRYSKYFCSSIKFKQELSLHRKLPIVKSISATAVSDAFSQILFLTDKHSEIIKDEL